MNESISFLRRPAVSAQVGLGRSSIYKLAALGEFPAPQKLTPCSRVSVWPSNVIDDWINCRIQGVEWRPAGSSGKSARRAKVTA